MPHGPLLCLVCSICAAALQANYCLAGRGFITVDALGKALLYDDRRHLDLSSARAVSVFHQLHCLVGFSITPLIGTLLYSSEANLLQDELRIGYYATKAPNHKAVNSDNKHHHSTAHMKHCFDYLRQALICAASMTLEPLRPLQNGKIPGVDGWGVEHICADWDEVRTWTEERRASGQRGIN